MNLSEVESEINKYFENNYFRQIVMWYDKDKEFEKNIENFNLVNAELYILEENSYFKAKYDIE